MPLPLTPAVPSKVVVLKPLQATDLYSLASSLEKAKTLEARRTPTLTGTPPALITKSAPKQKGRPPKRGLDEPEAMTASHSKAAKTKAKPAETWTTGSRGQENRVITNDKFRDLEDPNGRRYRAFIALGSQMKSGDEYYMVWSGCLVDREDKTADGNFFVYNSLTMPSVKVVRPKTPISIELGQVDLWWENMSFHAPLVPDRGDVTNFPSPVNGFIVGDYVSMVGFPGVHGYVCDKYLRSFDAGPVYLLVVRNQDSTFSLRMAPKSDVDGPDFTFVKPLSPWTRCMVKGQVMDHVLTFEKPRGGLETGDYVSYLGQMGMMAGSYLRPNGEKICLLGTENPSASGKNCHCLVMALEDDVYGVLSSYHAIPKTPWWAHLNALLLADPIHYCFFMKPLGGLFTGDYVSVPGKDGFYVDAQVTHAFCPDGVPQHFCAYTVVIPSEEGRTARFVGSDVKGPHLHCVFSAGSQQISFVDNVSLVGNLATPSRAEEAPTDWYYPGAKLAEECAKEASSGGLFDMLPALETLAPVKPARRGLFDTFDMEPSTLGDFDEGLFPSSDDSVEVFPALGTSLVNNGGSLFCSEVVTATWTYSSSSSEEFDGSCFLAAAEMLDREET